MMTLKQKIATGITLAVVTLAGLCGGCNTPTAYQKWRSNLTPEQEKKHSEDCKKASLELAMNEMKQQQGNYPLKSQEKTGNEQLLDVYKSLFWGLGTDIAGYEYMKRNP